MEDDNNYTGNEDGALMLQWLRGQRTGINPTPPQTGDVGNTLPSLTFRPEEWRMTLEKKSPFVMTEDGRTFDVSSRGDLEQIMTELDREDEIMSAVRAVARGG